MPTLWSLGDAAQEGGVDVLIGAHTVNIVAVMLLFCQIVFVAVSSSEHLVVVIIGGRGAVLMAAVVGVVTSRGEAEGKAAARIVIQVKAGEGRGEISEGVLERFLGFVAFFLLLCMPIGSVSSSTALV